MDVIKNFLRWCYMTHIGRVVTSFLLGTLFFALYDKTYFSYKDTLSSVYLTLAFTFYAILVGHILLWIAYGWIINPIRDFCSYKGKDTRFCKFVCKKCYDEV